MRNISDAMTEAIALTDKCRPAILFIGLKKKDLKAVQLTNQE